MTNNTGVWVVIPSWNGEEYISDCLDSLSSQTINHRVIVVDNGSIDNTVQLIKSRKEKTLVKQNKVNLGFAEGVNIGIEEAIKNDAKYVALLNNDAIADSRWLENLSKYADQNNSGVVTSKITNISGDRIDSTGEEYSRWGISYPRERGDRESTAESGEIFAASGGASLYRVEALKQTGLFDKDFFAYYEDVDISFRMHHKGWKVHYCKEALVRHVISGTSSRHKNFSYYHAVKNLNYVYLKNMPSKLLIKYGLLFVLRNVFTFFTSIPKLKTHIWIKSYLQYLTNLPSTIRKRLEIQKNSSISVDYMESLLTNRFR